MDTHVYLTFPYLQFALKGFSEILKGVLAKELHANVLSLGTLTEK